MAVENWVATDEAEDVAGSIRHAVKCWLQTPDDPQAWKWFALALHSGLQGACVCHLLTTARPIGAVTERNAGEWITYLNSRGGEPPKTHLMNLPELLKAVRKPNSAGDGRAGTAIEIAAAELQWLKRFHSTIRNQFIHFEPMGWSVEVSGLPKLAVLVSRIVGEVLDKDWGFRHKDLGWQVALRADLAALAGLDGKAAR